MGKIDALYSVPRPSSSSYVFSENNITDSLLSNEHTRKAAREARNSTDWPPVQLINAGFFLGGALLGEEWKARECGER